MAIELYCGRCKKWLHPEELGIYKSCEQCRDRDARWREANRDHLREYHQEWQDANMEHVLAYRREYYEANAEEKKAYSRWWAKENPERCLENSRRWQRENPERAREIKTRWRNKNRELVNQFSRRYQVRKLGATVEIFSPDELFEYWVDSDVNPDACAYCEDGPFEEIDHVVPLSRGGTHERANLAPACMPCNRSKGAKLLEEWRPGAYAA